LFPTSDWFGVSGITPTEPPAPSPSRWTRLVVSFPISPPPDIYFLPRHPFPPLINFFPLLFARRALSISALRGDICSFPAFLGARPTFGGSRIFRSLLGGAGTWYPPLSCFPILADNKKASFFEL
jgi:hypothetical protein